MSASTEEFDALGVGFDVIGIPAPQGSKRNQVRGRAVRLIESSASKVDAWRAAVAKAARTAVDGQKPVEGPVLVAVTFWLHRSVNTPKAWRWHRRTPDLDKLCRSTLDGMTGVVFQDDAQVARLVAQKSYADGLTGCHVEVAPLATSDGCEMHLDFLQTPISRRKPMGREQQTSGGSHGR